MSNKDLIVPNIGDLSTKLRVKIEISKISKGILKCKGEVEGEFLDNCQKCLEKTTVKLDDAIDVVKEGSDYYAYGKDGDKIFKSQINNDTGCPTGTTYTNWKNNNNN